MTNTARTSAQLMQVCLEQAEAFPASHDQDHWLRVEASNPCGTTGCLAGHAVLLGTEDLALEVDRSWFTAEGDDVSASVFRLDADDRVAESFVLSTLASDLLGLDNRDSAWMFSPFRTLDEMWEFAGELYPGEVVRPDEVRLDEIRAAGPLLVPAVLSARYRDFASGEVGVVGELIAATPIPHQHLA